MTTADDRTERAADPAAEPATDPVDAPGAEDSAAGSAGSAGPAGAAGNPFGPELGPLVDEVRRFAGVVGQRAQDAGAEALLSLAGLSDRLRERQPEVYGHLLAAGGELLAAYRAAVAGHEKRWTAGQGASTERIDLDADRPTDPTAAPAPDAGPGAGSEPGADAGRE